MPLTARGMGNRFKLAVDSSQDGEPFIGSLLLPRCHNAINNTEDVVYRSTGSEEIVKELKVKVYCSCRKQQHRRKMAQCIKCNDWFQQNCENTVDAVVRKRAPFTCSSCKE